MNTAKQVESMLAEWKQQGLSKPSVVIKLANACIGWDYVFGARGEECTPSNRRDYYNKKKIASIKDDCKNYSGDKGCSGCKFYHGGVTRFYDCRGFTYWCLLKGAGVKINGGGATTQYDDDSNWVEKGEISNMPKDKVCCVFRYDSNTTKMEHTLLYDGNGNYIHCSGEVKKCAVSKYKATHYAIPKGLYDNKGGVETMETAKTYASNGGAINMRAGKSTSTSILKHVPNGAEVEVLERGDGWSKVKYEGCTGYIMNSYLLFSDSPTPVTPSVNPQSNFVSVNKEELEKVYAMIGAWLKR